MPHQQLQGQLTETQSVRTITLLRNKSIKNGHRVSLGNSTEKKTMVSNLQNKEEHKDNTTMKNTTYRE